MKTETVKIKIKKSSNHLAWSNANIGKVLIATKEKNGTIANVRKEDNPNIIVNNSFVAGYVYQEDYEIIK